MRKMSDEERAVTYQAPDYRCCFCRGDLQPGPRGGASINMTCADCGAVLNLIAPEYRERYGEGIQFFGEVVREPSPRRGAN